ncbi:MAG: hypothetical protein ACLUTA_17180 [Blautia wexlerae]
MAITETTVKTAGMADIGNVNKKYIVGKVWFVISPKDKFGFLKG